MSPRASLNLLLCLALLPPEVGLRHYRLAWSDLPPLITGREVKMTLPDGTRVQGNVLAVDADALILNLRKTSDRSAWPKGRASIPRAAVTTFRLTEKTGYTWKVVGTAIGAGIGLFVGIPMAIYGANEGGGEFAAIAATAIGLGTVLGYLAGWSADRKTTAITVVPDTRSVLEQPLSDPKLE